MHRPIVPIRSVPGGKIDPEHMVGREAEAAAVTRAISDSGALVTGDRRVGKTSLLRKLVALWTSQPEAYVVVSISAQTTDPATFAARLEAGLRKYTRFYEEPQKWKVIFKRTLGPLTLQRETENGEVTTEDLFTWAARQVAPRRLVIVIDEVTVLAQALQKDGPQGLEFLHSLRAAREGIENLSLVLAGSIGVHHVVSDMTVISGLARLSLGPLEREDALHLARCLMAGHDLVEDETVVHQLVESTDGFPYFLHHLVASVAKLERPISSADIDDLINTALRDPNDPWDVKHYRDRIRAYYGADLESLVFACVDACALAANPQRSVTLQEVMNHVATKEFEKRPTRDQIIGVFEKLRADHLIVRLPNDELQFASQIIARAWRVLRFLEN
jgi:AAA domain